MRKYIFILALILGLCSFNQLSWAEKKYVTDSFAITFRTGPSTDNKIVSMLKSGQALEIMEEIGDWSRVQVLEEGEDQKEGWVLSRFLITRLPWEMQASTLREENRRLIEKLSPIEKQLSDATDREKDIAKKLQDTTRALQKIEKKYDALKKSSADFLKLKASYETTQSKLEALQKEFKVVSDENEGLRSSQSHKWFGTGALVLLIGLIFGLVLGRQQRKRRSSLYY